jgi:hypothetical protein
MTRSRSSYWPCPFGAQPVAAVAAMAGAALCLVLVLAGRPAVAAAPRRRHRMIWRWLLAEDGTPLWRLPTMTVCGATHQPGVDHIIWRPLTCEGSLVLSPPRG